VLSSDFSAWPYFSLVPSWFPDPAYQTNRAFPDSIGLVRLNQENQPATITRIIVPRISFAYKTLRIYEDKGLPVLGKGRTVGYREDKDRTGEEI